MSLSDNIKDNHDVSNAHLLLRYEGGVIPTKDVREFIKELKKQCFELCSSDGIEFRKIIDELTGKKLV